MRCLLIAVGVGLAALKVLRSEDGVEEGLESLTPIIYCIHLVEVGTGDHGCLHAVGPQLPDESLKAADEDKVHRLLKLVEPFNNERLFRLQIAVEMAVENLQKGLTLYLVFQTWAVGAELTALRSPKLGVLWLGVENHPVEVEQCCLKRYIIHLYWFLGAKVTLFCQLTKKVGKNITLRAS